MKAILVFIDGTICDTRERHHLIGTPDFYRQDSLLADRAVPGSAACLNELAPRYEIVYLGGKARLCLPTDRAMAEEDGIS